MLLVPKGSFIGYNLFFNKTFLYNRYDAPINITDIKIGKETYYINQKKCYLYTDIGPCYQKQYINSNTSTYILVFEVNDININKTYLIYSEDLENKTKIKLRLEDYILKS